MHAIGRSVGGLAVAVALSVAASSAGLAQDAAPTPEEMWRIIQEQQAVIEELRAEVEATREQVAETDEKVEATGELVESTLADGADSGGWWSNTQIGGYGEVHYNAGEVDKVDVHRLVLFLGHDFSDTVRFAGELEVEHALAGEGKPGEVEVEQAFIEYDFAANAAARAGVFLIPVGLLNETHEPPTYYGVERNYVENKIIPTTWWEAGVGLAGQLGNGLSYDVSMHSGLAVKDGDDWQIRGGRKKVANAPAKSPAYTARLRWTGMPGVEVGGTVQYQSDVTQDGYVTHNTRRTDGVSGVSATLMEGHVDVRRGMFGLRALVASWTLDGDAPAAVGKDEQWGYFIEPAFRFDAGGMEVGLFARYTMYDQQAGDDADSENTIYNFGTNIWLHEDVVLKLDYEMFQKDGADDKNTFHAGVGFQF